jgi:transcriptional regulator with XRE-family HTH domain
VTSVTSPTVRRRRLSTELRRLREESKWTIDEVAHRIGVSASSLSRVENGVVGIKIPVLRALLDEYGVQGDQVARLEKLAREGSKPGWWKQLHVELPEKKAFDLAGFESEAEQIDQFEVTLIPGLVQTPGYADALVRTLLSDRSENEIERTIEFRMRRQEQVLGVRKRLILAEEILLRPVGGIGVMQQQILRLVAANSDSFTEVRILPLSRGAHPGISGPFKILRFREDPPLVYVEGNNFDNLIEDQSAVNVYNARFSKVLELALDPTESTLLLHQIAERLERLPAHR